jgi:hypothetical protein
VADFTRRTFLNDPPLGGMEGSRTPTGDQTVGRAYSLAWQEIGKAINEQNQKKSKHSEETIECLKSLREELKEAALSHQGARVNELPPEIQKQFLDIHKLIDQLIKDLPTKRDLEDWRRELKGFGGKFVTPNTVSGTVAQLGAGAIGGAFGLGGETQFAVRAIQEGIGVIRDIKHSVGFLNEASKKGFEKTRNAVDALNEYLNPNGANSFVNKFLSGFSTALGSPLFQKAVLTGITIVVAKILSGSKDESKDRSKEGGIPLPPTDPRPKGGAGSKQSPGPFTGGSIIPQGPDFQRRTPTAPITPPAPVPTTPPLTVQELNRLRDRSRGRRLPKYARGGLIPLGGAGIVGEEGPELVQAQPGGGIVTSNSASGLGPPGTQARAFAKQRREDLELLLAMLEQGDGQWGGGTQLAAYHPSDDPTGEMGRGGAGFLGGGRGGGFPGGGPGGFPGGGPGGGPGRRGGGPGRRGGPDTGPASTGPDAPVSIPPQAQLTRPLPTGPDQTTTTSIMQTPWGPQPVPSDIPKHLQGLPKTLPWPIQETTSGGSAAENLKNIRAPYFAEMEKDPHLKRTVERLAWTENSNDMTGVMESMMNRAAMSGKKLRDIISPDFYGPLQPGHLLRNDPRDDWFKAAYERVKGGSNTIEYRTDQGMWQPGHWEHPYAVKVGAEKAGLRKYGGEWYSYMGEKGVEWANKMRAMESKGGKKPTTTIINTATGMPVINTPWGPQPVSPSSRTVLGGPTEATASVVATQPRPSGGEVTVAFSGLRGQIDRESLLKIDPNAKVFDYGPQGQKEALEYLKANPGKPVRVIGFSQGASDTTLGPFTRAAKEAGVNITSVDDIGRSRRSPAFKRNGMPGETISQHDPGMKILAARQPQVSPQTSSTQPPAGATELPEIRVSATGPRGGGTDSSTGPGVGPGVVTQSQSRVAETRKGPISSTLNTQLNYAAAQAGVQVEVVSGGQPSSGRNRTGSHRHDLGGAADLYLSIGGRRLNPNRPEDYEKIKQFAYEAARAGATGIGFGRGYMGLGEIHVGGGTQAVWGAGGAGSNVDPGVAAAVQRGWRDRAKLGAPDFTKTPTQATQPAPSAPPGVIYPPPGLILILVRGIQPLLLRLLSLPHLRI